MIVDETIIHLLFLGLGYQSFKALQTYNELEQKKKSTPDSLQLKAESAKIDEHLIRILMKWITTILYMKLFWIIEAALFFFPGVLFIKICIGIWIMYPSLEGEKFMYLLLSDQLDRFEKEIRRVRNQIFGKSSKLFLRIAKFLIKRSRAYLHSDILKASKDMIVEMLAEVEMELERRRKGGYQDYPGFERDSTVLTSEQLKQRLSMSISQSAHQRQPDTQAPSGPMPQVYQSQFQGQTGQTYARQSEMVQKRGNVTTRQAVYPDSQKNMTFTPSEDTKASMHMKKPSMQSMQQLNHMKKPSASKAPVTGIPQALPMRQNLVGGGRPQINQRQGGNASRLLDQSSDNALNNSMNYAQQHHYLYSEQAPMDDDYFEHDEDLDDGNFMGDLTGQSHRTNMNQTFTNLPDIQRGLELNQHPQSFAQHPLQHPLQQQVRKQAVPGKVLTSRQVLPGSSAKKDL